ncbi:MAG: IclR family transcriptional regulator [Alicyclobacillus sp.]|nr:IclR family transcriptional regulator [Alicyclobacillus sp.]
MDDEHVLLSSVRNAIRLLRQFSPESPELGVKELSERLGLHKNKVFRLVRTLCEEHVIQQNPETRKYSLSVGAFEIGSVFYHEIDICTVAFPILEILASRLGEVIQMAIYDSGDVVYLLKFPEDQATMFFNGMGRRVPCYCTAVGKALLAFQTQSEIDRVTQLPMQQFTRNTVTDPVKLRAELELIRERGYADSREQYRKGMSALAVPIFDDMSNRVVAAISLTCPERHFVSHKVRYLVDELKKCSGLITRHLESVRWKRRKFMIF